MKSNDEIITELITKGAIEIDAIDQETGEFLYKITDKMKDVNKALYDEHINSIYASTMYFWEKGLVEFSDFSAINPTISLTVKAFDSEAILSLPPEKIKLFNQLKASLGFFK
jgi:hypothetical protein